MNEDLSQTDFRTKADRCSAYPGVWKASLDAKRTEQKLTLVGGAKGCIEEKGGSLRNVMKFLAISAGLKSVHRRPDRDQAITINEAGIEPGTNFQGEQNLDLY